MLDGFVYLRTLNDMNIRKSEKQFDEGKEMICVRIKFCLYLTKTSKLWDKLFNLFTKPQFHFHYQ